MTRGWRNPFGCRTNPQGGSQQSLLLLIVILVHAHRVPEDFEFVMPPRLQTASPGDRNPLQLGHCPQLMVPYSEQLRALHSSTHFLWLVRRCSEIHVLEMT